MRLKVSEDKKFLIVVESTQLEYEQLESSFTKKTTNWAAVRGKSHLPKTFETKFIDAYARIPIGLWSEVQKFAKKFMFNIEIDGIEHLYDKDYDESDFIEWVNTYFEESEKPPRDYQIEGVSRALKYRYCTEEISTSGGKTLMAFLFFRYLLERKKIKKMLYVVPNISLVTQTEEEFYDYEESCGTEKPVWKSQCVYGGSGKKENVEANIVFGTFQSLVKKDIEYFAKFDAILIDECLHPDTLILMEDFSKKKIKDIKIGEKVWTINEKTNSVELKEIEFIYKNLSKSQQMYEIEMEDGNMLKITGNHKVLTQNNIWKRVDELNENDEIISFDMMNI